MNLDHGNGEDRERVTNAVAVVGPGSSIDENAGNSLGKALMNTQAHVTLAVCLVALYGHAEFFTECLQLGIDVSECGRSILNRVTLTKHIVINAMQHQKLFHGSSRR